jgi:hypothetical protein
MWDWEILTLIPYVAGIDQDITGRPLEVPVHFRKDNNGHF